MTTDISTLARTFQGKHRKLGKIVGAASSGATPTVSEGYLYRNGQVSLLRDLVPDDGCWNRLEAREAVPLNALVHASGGM